MILSCTLLCLSMVFEIRKQMKKGDQENKSFYLSVSNFKHDLMNFILKIEDHSILDEPQHIERVKYLLKRKEVEALIEAKNYDSKFRFILDRGRRFLSDNMKVEPGFVYSTRVLSSSILAFFDYLLIFSVGMFTEGGCD